MLIKGVPHSIRPFNSTHAFILDEIIGNGLSRFFLKDFALEHLVSKGFLQTLHAFKLFFFLDVFLDIFDSDLILYFIIELLVFGLIAREKKLVVLFTF